MESTTNGTHASSIFRNVCKYQRRILQTMEFPKLHRGFRWDTSENKSPSHSGSMYYNYKLFSIVLQAVCGAKYRFTMIDVGGYGWQSDGGTFQSSNMYKPLSKKKLKIPEDRCLPNKNIKMPFVL